MPLRTAKLSAFIALLVISLPISVLAAEKKAKLNIAGSLWPPYIDKQLPNMGAATDLVKNIFLRAGYDVDLTQETWPRTLQGTDLGVYDAIIAAWYTEERNKNYAFTEPYFTNEIVFIKRIGTDIQYNSLDDLRGILIGVVTGYAYHESFDNNRSLLKVSANYLTQNLIKLKFGQIDLTLGDKWAIQHEILSYMQDTTERFEYLPKPLAKRGLHVAVSRQNPKHDEIVADFNKALANMKKDGTYKAIIEPHAERLFSLKKK